MVLNDRLTGPETEALRYAFAHLRALAAKAQYRGDQQRLRAACRRLAPDRAEAPFLSEREIDVLAHVATGLHNSEIAERLTLKPETVKSYVRSALTKLCTHSRYEAVIAARRAGLLP
ncbi:response regulator receiver protein [Mycobacterium lentiflavum]|uniref:Response regulator receiver protein n=1 Tax=Mycobacterium lentiflavum TaxID=141349 RepID=A0A0E3WEB1_MYCLN|nr:LuxR C-terminal-related transcriptional regulator [Mycobacterium lentiflavum]CQD24328.1 response regulator receiver protein [Mycobacterium lentiflavum]